MLERYPVKMFNSLGIIHHGSPRSSLFFGGRKALNCLASITLIGAAGAVQFLSPDRVTGEIPKKL